MVQRRILFVALTQNWSSSERSLVSYARALIKRGHQVSFYTQRDSFIDSAVKSLAKEGHDSCKIFYHLGGTSVQFLRWSAYRHTRRVILANEIDLVIFDTVTHFFPISFLLRRSLHISLFVFQNSLLLDSYRNFWLSPLKRRLDLVFTTVSDAVGNIKGSLGISERKIKVFGLSFDNKELSCDSPSDWGVDSFVIGTVFCPSKKNILSLKPLLKAVSVLKEMEEFQNISVKLKVFTQNDWKFFILTNELKELIKKLKLESEIELVSGSIGLNSDDEKISLDDFLRQVDITVGLDEIDYLEDWSMLGILLGKPALVTRKGGTKEFFRKVGAVGDTYRANDSRELRDKLLKIFNSKVIVSHNLELLSKKLCEEHRGSAVAKELEERFEISLLRRRRLSIRKSILGNR